MKSYEVVVVIIMDDVQYIPKSTEAVGGVEAKVGVDIDKLLKGSDTTVQAEGGQDHVPHKQLLTEVVSWTVLHPSLHTEHDSHVGAHHVEDDTPVLVEPLYPVPSLEVAFEGHH